MEIPNGKSLFDQVRAALLGCYPATEAAAIAWRVVETHTGLGRMAILAGKNPAHFVAADFAAIIHRLQAHEPVQYVLGETEFAGFKLKVSPAVLIPRPETEELVAWIAQEQAATAGPVPPIFLDMGTGSGAIALALAKLLAPVRAIALDISPAALALAQENALAQHTLIDFRQVDMLALVGAGSTLEWPIFDFIVSNPPYVMASEAGAMHPNVLDHEPHLALFVPDDDPLRFYRAIGQFARHHLKPGGPLYLEINEQLGAATSQLLRSIGFQHLQIRPDVHGKDRMLRACI